MRAHHTRIAILLALLAASPALAGCLGTAQATAMEQRDPAEDRAEAWADNPRLLEIVGIEGSFSIPTSTYDVDAAHWERASDDPNIGDGRTELWIYRFLAEEEPDTVLTVIVDKDGEIIAEDREPRGSDDRPLGDWNVDSDEAAEEAMDANEGLREGTSKENYGIVMHLGGGEDHANPVWLIAGGGGDASGGGGGMVVVDAVTGEVLESQGGAART